MIRLIFLLLLAVAVPGVATAQAPASREQIRLSFAPIVKKAAPAVVNVYSRRVVRARSPLFDDPFFRRFFGGDSPFGLNRERVQNSLGSGVIVDPQGLIVTNHHVIVDADEIRVVLSDRREFEAKVVLSDEHSDLAVLKIDLHGGHLPALPIGDSDGLEVGDLVLAIGDPFGVGQTVTSGIVSALARSIGAADFRSFIQTDAAINPGNSGGALIDLDGNLVGINTAIFSRSGGSMGLGFAIPSAMVKVVLDAVRHGGKFVRPWFGASGDAVTYDTAEALKLPHPTGVLIKTVAPDSPAAAAGLKPGDVILAIGSHDIDDPDVFKFRVATLPLNRAASVTYWRDGESRTASVTVATIPDTPPRDLTELDGRHPFAGATVGNLNPAFDDEMGFDPTVRGVVVDRVAPQTNAQRIGLQPGDIIVSLGERPIKDVGELKQELETAGGPWTFAVRRKDKTLTVTVR
jgi:serine protease Do